MTWATWWEDIDPKGSGIDILAVGRGDDPRVRKAFRKLPDHIETAWTDGTPKTAVAHCKPWIVLLFDPRSPELAELEGSILFPDHMVGWPVMIVSSKPSTLPAYLRVATEWVDHALPF